MEVIAQTITTYDGEVKREWVRRVFRIHCEVIVHANYAYG
jgi:hypothetical protein